jgi:hypothetical protein
MAHGHPASQPHRHHPERARIVPLKKEAAHIAPAAIQLLEYHGGPLMTNVQIFTAFWGAAWQQAQQADLAGRLNDFFSFIVTSPLLDQLAEYSVPGFAIGQGSFLGSTTVDVALPNLLPDDQVQQLLQAQIAAGGDFPQPSPNTLYFVFLPPGVVSDLQGDQSCRDQCGYHESIDGQIFYAVIPYATCPGCTRGFTLFDSLTRVASHEMCEAITDPNGDGWFTSGGEEIGDLCPEGTKQVGPYQVQTEFSNQQRACV